MCVRVPIVKFIIYIYIVKLTIGAHNVATTDKACQCDLADGQMVEWMKMMMMMILIVNVAVI